MSTCSRFLNLQPSYTIDLNKQQEQQLYDHDQVVLHHHNMTPPVSFSSLEPRCSSSSSSSFPPIFSNPVQDQIGYLYMGSQLHQSTYQHEVENFGSYESGLYDQTALEINKDVNGTNLKFTICKKDDRNLDGGNGGVSDSGAEMNGPSVKWMPLRIMKKIMRAEENQKTQVPPVPVKLETRDLISKTLIGKSHITSNNNDNNTIRVCSDCNTTKTPLWRSGPKGPKSLCNACGIRQRKARRAMAVATNGSILPSNMSSSMMRTVNSHKKAPNNNNGFGTQKRRSKVVKPSRDHHHRKICFEEFALNLSKKLSLQQVFPQEEKEAAILLMALSCGFVHG